MNIMRMNLIVPLLVGSALMSVLVWADIPSARSDCLSGKSETTPSSDFTEIENGSVVRHETTGLEWRRCSEGMIWSGSYCSGNAQSYVWKDALQHADNLTGWRLPDIDELRSIVEHCRVGPTINQQVFPNTPTSGFWSASTSSGESGRAWTLLFLNGNDNWNPTSVSRRVRLDRKSVV